MANIASNQMAEETMMNSALSTRVTKLLETSVNFYMEYLVTRQLNDLDHAVRCAHEMQELIPPSIFNMMGTTHMGRTMLRRFQHAGQIQDLSFAIDILWFTVRNTVMDEDPCHLSCLGYLSICYLERDGNLDGLLELNSSHEQSQSRALLEGWARGVEEVEEDEVFKYCQKKVNGQLHSHPGLEVVDSGIQFCRQAIRFFSSDGSRVGGMLLQLGNLLSYRFSVQNDLENLDEAFNCCSVSMELLWQIPHNIVNCHFLASKVLLQRSEKLGKEEDLHNAILSATQAVELIDKLETNLADSPILSAVLLILAKALNIRYWRNGRAEDLINIVAIAQRALDCLLPNDPRRVDPLIFLANSEVWLCFIHGDLAYINRASDHLKQAGNIPGLNFKDKHYVAISWVWFILSLEHISPLQEIARSSIDAVIDMALECESTADDAEGRGNLNIHLSQVLCLRWKLRHDKKDIDKAIIAARQALEFTGGNLDALTRLTLGECLYERYKGTRDNCDRDEALAILREGFLSPIGGTHSRILAGQVAIDILCEMGDWDSARMLSQEIIDLFVVLNNRSHAWSEKLVWVRTFCYRFADYASIALEAGSSALDVIGLLETCRGSILGHLIDTRTDLDELVEADPEKATRFKALQNEINAGGDPGDLLTSMNFRVKQTTRRIDAEAEIRACLQEIRMLDGFHQFLLGPTERELKAAASRGPIVIVNVTALRSDAIIVTKDVVLLLRLLELKCETLKKFVEEDLSHFDFEVVGRKNKRYRDLQGWLWDTCVKFIFQKLESLGYGSKKFHIWWMGTGLANFLPFHAAGKYCGNFGETSLSRAISSYTPTLKLLIHAQQKLNVKNNILKLDMHCLSLEEPVQKSKPTLTIVTMPSTPGKCNLEGVQQEAEGIQGIVEDTFSTVVLIQPSAEKAMAQMAKCEIVHFACHGELTIPNVSDSHLLLQSTSLDSMPTVDKLKLRDVVAAPVSHGKLAFLSACSTAENNMALGLWDEVLHLVSGFQVAGYLHSIGNLWPADDEISVNIVKGFYKHLVAAGEFGDGDHVARALNEALLDFAKMRPKQPLSWAQFVHFGI